VGDGCTARGPQEMLPHVQVDPSGRRLIDVTFSPQGGWFHRYSNRTVNWCTDPDASLMGAAFHGLVMSCREGEPKRGEHNIEYLTLGVDGTLLCRFENGLFCREGGDENFDPQLLKALDEREADGWTITDMTKLCPYDKDRWFAQFRKGDRMENMCRVGDADLNRHVLDVLSGRLNDVAKMNEIQNAQHVSVFFLTRFYE
jgi:hypothetical protein